MIEEIRQEKGLLEKYSSLDIKQAKETFRLLERSRAVLTAGNGTSYNAAYYLSLLFLMLNIKMPPRTILSWSVLKVYLDRAPGKLTCNMIRTERRQP